MAITKVTMTLEGLDALKRAVVECPKEFRKDASDAVRKSTWSVADKMRRRVSVRSGHLLGSIESRVPVTSGLIGRVEIDGDAYYWRFLEYGTINMTARPFARPAAEEESQHYIDRFITIARKLERLWGSK